LVGQRLQPRVGSRLLAMPSRACRVCLSAWLASLVTEVVVAGPEPMNLKPATCTGAPLLPAELSD